MLRHLVRKPSHPEDIHISSMGPDMDSPAPTLLTKPHLKTDKVLLRIPKWKRQSIELRITLPHGPIEANILPFILHFSIRNLRFALDDFRT